MLTFKALHVLSMFAAVTLLIGEHLFYAVAVRRRDVRALAAIRRISGPRPVVAVALLLSGIVFGLLTALTGGFDFFAGWLIVAYVLIAAILVVGGSPWVRRLPLLGEKAIEAEAGSRPVEEVVHDMAHSHAGALFLISAALFVAVILDMVLKPF